MIPVLGAMVIALLIAAGFGALGDDLLGKRSADLRSWNESFLAGAGVCAALLVPLSMVAGRHALNGILALLGVAMVAAIVRRWRTRSERIGPAHREPALRDPVAVALSALLAIVALSFATLNFRYSYLWDGFQIWASKAQILYHQGRLGPEWYPGSETRPLALKYPPLVPLYEALLCAVRGEFDFDVLKPVFLVFYLSMLASTFAATRSILSIRWALAAALVVALLPALSTGTPAGGYADMPQAAMVAGAMAAGLRETPEVSGWRNPLPWLIGAMTTVKAEGTLLALCACAAIAGLWMLESPRRFLARCRRHAAGAGVLLAFLGLRWGYLRWANVHDLTYGPLDAAHFAQAWARIPEAAALCWRELVDPRDWALLWPAFFLAAGALIVRGPTRERCLAVTTLAALAAYSSIFLFSNWTLDMHVPNAYPRLLAHLAPAAAVTVFLGYARLRAGSDSPADATTA